MPGKHWTNSEEQYLIELVNDGLPNREIAEIMGRTAGAINNKKIDLRDPNYYADARARSDEAEAYAMNEEEKMKKPDFEAIFIVLMGMTVFSILAVGALLNAGSGL